ncbi:hypothetical protein NDI56_00735 [Haloarcula sp. S1CR25-12]|uniref:DUF7311 domain-containing protein n=1 Tax=Haloarcula saliterrae TaxID=2950534 RepID=A0ABU2F7L1_9EURY|nr:hypothetical protein [Haloarcula sp. S1CR25-12]MDS0257928.1 hypothetical protein [Haloarcula sp. S1CR25-12]
MILRVVLAVVLTTALVTVAAPAVSVAGADRAESTVDRQLTTLASNLGQMVAIDDPTAGRGARHVTALRLPGRTLTSADVTRLRLYGREGVGLASWRVSDGAESSTRLSGVPIRAVGGGSLTLRESGTHRLVFGLDKRANRTVLTVRRPGGDGDA